MVHARTVPLPIRWFGIRRQSRRHCACEVVLAVQKCIRIVSLVLIERCHEVQNRNGIAGEQVRRQAPRRFEYPNFAPLRRSYLPATTLLRRLGLPPAGRSPELERLHVHMFVTRGVSDLAESDFKRHFLAGVTVQIELCVDTFVAKRVGCQTGRVGIDSHSHDSRARGNRRTGRNRIC